MIYISNIVHYKYSTDTLSEHISKVYTDIYLLSGQSQLKKQEKRELAAFKLHEISHRKCYSDQDLYTNKSYTQGLTALAISNQNVGIDIEAINLDFDYQELSASIFSKDELEKLQHLTPLEFFRSWTRKEAILKSCNSGIINELELIPSLDGSHNLPELDLFNDVGDLHVYSFEHDNNILSICGSNKLENIRVVILEN